MIDKLNESEFLRDSQVEYKFVLRSTLSLALWSLLPKLDRFSCLGGECLSALSTICLFGYVVCRRSFALNPCNFHSTGPLNNSFISTNCCQLQIKVRTRSSLSLLNFVTKLKLLGGKFVVIFLM